MIWVSAQVIEFNRRAGAVHFLTLRDTTEEVSVAVTLSTAVLDAAGPVSEGMAVTAQLKPTVWLKSGRLSYECFDLRPTGEGQLLAQIEHLKRLLHAEGLFDPSRKRTLPLLPRGIGLITGRDSAAERDVVVNTHLRWPGAHIETRHCLMQGPLSSQQIMEALAELDADPTIDVIVIARGGGSVEDLLPFSDEALVRAVCATKTVVVSAIGHEVDTPVLDLVADLRASTPTDAAKRIVPDAREEAERLSRFRQRCAGAIKGFLAHELGVLRQIRHRSVLRDPLARFDVYAEQVSSLRHRLAQVGLARIDREAAHVARASALVRSLSPQSVLTRGYAILVGADQETIASTDQVKIGSSLTAHLADGTLAVQVTHMKKESHGNAKKET
jgi:exodeoxyribonuclease VII large subunit